MPPDIQKQLLEEEQEDFVQNVSLSCNGTTSVSLQVGVQSVSVGSYCLRLRFGLHFLTLNFCKTIHNGRNSSNGPDLDLNMEIGGMALGYNAPMVLAL
jgi:hypothetical protein